MTDRQRYGGLGRALRWAFGPPRTKQGEDTSVPNAMEAAAGLTVAAQHLSNVSTKISDQTAPPEAAPGAPKKETLEAALRRLAELCR
jgi:hypothetical protein